MRRRSSGSIFSMRAAADACPPLRPRATAAAFFRREGMCTTLSGRFGSSPSVSAAMRWTTRKADLFGSLDGRFLLNRFGIFGVSHGHRNRAKLKEIQTEALPPPRAQEQQSLANMREMSAAFDAADGVSGMMTAAYALAMAARQYLRDLPPGPRAPESSNTVDRPRSLGSQETK
jgi:hypothetical protein